MSDRADEVVNYVKQIHRDYVESEGRDESTPGNVLIITHGHFSRVRRDH
jgi:hypothetical protein